MNALKARLLLDGEASGPLLKLSADISFWGGVDPLTGRIIDSRHPEHGRFVSGKVLAMQRSIGSSSGSSILLELLQRNRGPLGIILVQPDFILTLGALVAREMGYRRIPVAKIKPETFSNLPSEARVEWSGARLRIS